MADTPTWNLALPEDGQTPWGDDYRDALTVIDERLFAIRGSIFTDDNDVATTIGTAGVAVKANLGAVESGPSCQFCETDGDLIRYLGPLDRVPLVLCSFTVEAQANRTVGVSVRKNGGAVGGARARLRFGPNVTVSSGSFSANIPVSADDVLEVFITNETSDDDVTVTDLTLVARG